MLDFDCFLGILMFADGDRYEGEFKEDDMNGQGNE